MKRILAAVLIVLTLVLNAPTQTPETPFQHLIKVRDKLIQRYVLTNHYVWGVSACGEADQSVGYTEEWLTIYVYGDSIPAFANDFVDLVTEVDGVPQVDGVPIELEQVNRK